MGYEWGVSKKHFAYELCEQGEENFGHYDMLPVDVSRDSCQLGSSPALGMGLGSAV